VRGHNLFSGRYSSGGREGAAPCCRRNGRSGRDAPAAASGGSTGDRPPAKAAPTSALKTLPITTIATNSMTGRPKHRHKASRTDQRVTNTSIVRRLNCHGTARSLSQVPSGASAGWKSGSSVPSSKVPQFQQASKGSSISSEHLGQRHIDPMTPFGLWPSFARVRQSHTHSSALSKLIFGVHYSHFG